MRRIPSGVHPQTEAEIEQTLAGHARRFEPRPLAQITHRVLAHVDPDGPAPTEPPPPPARELHLRPNDDGSLRLDGRLDNEGAALVRTVLDSLNGRRPDTDPGGPDDARLRSAMVTPWSRPVRCCSTTPCCPPPVGNTRTWW